MTPTDVSDQGVPALKSARSRRHRIGSAALEGIARYGVVLAVVVLFISFSIALPDTFFTVANVKTMVNSQAILLMLAIAVTLTLRVGEFDLSIASVMTVGAVLTGQLASGGGGVIGALLAVLAFAVIVGLVHSFLILRIGVDSFITTLGTLTALGGAAFAITETQTITGFPDALLSIARTEIFGLPMPTWYAWLLVAAMWYLYERTPTGRYLLFTGGNPDAARLAGLRVDRLRAGAFVGSAIISAMAGFLLAGSVGSVDPAISDQYLLQPFAAAFLGATTIQLGRFNALGTVVGLYLLVIGITGLQLLGAQPWVANVFNGVALVVAVTAARLAARARGAQS